jgi:hypothetical protein
MCGIDEKNERNKEKGCVRFEVSTAVTMMIIIFWERHGVISQKMIIIKRGMDGRILNWLLMKESERLWTELI